MSKCVEELPFCCSRRSLLLLLRHNRLGKVIRGRRLDELDEWFGNFFRDRDMASGGLRYCLIFLTGKRFRCGAIVVY